LDKNSLEFFILNVLEDIYSLQSFDENLELYYNNNYKLRKINFIMSEISDTIMKFERMMILNKQERQMHLPEKKQKNIIGYMTYNFEDETEKFTPTLKYRIISSFNKFYSKMRSYFHNK